MIPSAVNPYADRPPGPGEAQQMGPPPPEQGARAAGEPEPVFKALCGLMVRTQVTKVRIAALLGLCCLAMLSGVAYGNGVRTGAIAQPLHAGAAWIDEFGLGFMVPVATLLFASSMFGDPNDDKTLVYLWLRPVARGRIVLAAALTSFVVTWPLVVPALAATAAFTGGGRDLVVGTIVASTIGVASCTGVFVTLGARVRQPLVWGLLYVMIWEKYAATASTITKVLSLRAYGASILQDFTRTKLELDFLPLAVAVPLALGIGTVALVFATRHLSNQDVA